MTKRHSDEQLEDHDERDRRDHRGGNPDRVDGVKPIGGELSRPKHELYARGRAAGMTQEDAHKAAGYTGNRSAACQIEAQEVEAVDGHYKAMRQRIREIQAHALTLNDITPEVLMTRAWDLSETAESESVKASMIKLMGQAHGMWIDRRVEDRREYDVAAMLKVIAGDNPALMERIAEQIPLMPGERENL